MKPGPNWVTKQMTFVVCGPLQSEITHVKLPGGAFWLSLGDVSRWSRCNVMVPLCISAC